MPDTTTETLRPACAAELAEALRDAGLRNLTVELGGHFSKRMMGGPVGRADRTIATTAMNRVLNYEPRDLTISVEAGMRYAELNRLLAEHKQTIPLDPPFSETATVGGVIATNGSGPRRRLYGTARDMVIGMQFATMEGKLVQSGGMVVKNVAGLDMGKVMIGSFGTLAAITVVNFKVIPQPPFARTFAFAFPALDDAVAARDAILRSVLQPAAIDLMNPAALANAPGFVLAVEVGGNAAAMERYEREFAAMGGKRMSDGPGVAFWSAIRDFTPRFLEANPNGAVVRVSCTLKELRAVMHSIEGPAIARAGSGVCYAYFEDAGRAAEWASATARQYRQTVIEFSPEDRKKALDLWPMPGSDLELMQRIKYMFDPHHLLNRGRL